MNGPEQHRIQGTPQPHALGCLGEDPGSPVHVVEIWVDEQHSIFVFLFLAVMVSF